MAGRPEGSKNRKTMEWEQLGEFLTEEGAERAKEIMRNASDNVFMKYYTMLLEYFRPTSEVRGEKRKRVRHIGGLDYIVPDEIENKLSS